MAALLVKGPEFQIKQLRVAGIKMDRNRSSEQHLSVASLAPTNMITVKKMLGSNSSQVREYISFGTEVLCSE